MSYHEHYHGAEAKPEQKASIVNISYYVGEVVEMFKRIEAQDDQRKIQAGGADRPDFEEVFNETALMFPNMGSGLIHSIAKKAHKKISGAS